MTAADRTAPPMTPCPRCAVDLASCPRHLNDDLPGCPARKREKGRDYFCTLPRDHAGPHVGGEGMDRCTWGRR